MYQVGGVEVGLQFELLVETDALTLGHLVGSHVDHEPDCGVCVVLLVVTGRRQHQQSTVENWSTLNTSLLEMVLQ